MATKLFTDTEICLKCVDNNEILYDTGEKYLQRIKAVQLDCPEEMFEEILRNMELCEKVLFMNIKQRTILNESRVRFNAKKDVAEMQTEISESNLSKECKDYFRDVSRLGYECLKVEQFFKHFVEFDSERLSYVRIHGKNEKMVCHFDMVALIHDIPTTSRQSLKLAEKMKSKKSTRKKVINRNNNPDEKFGKTDEKEKTTINKKTDKSEDLERVVLSVKLMARNHIKALDIFRQLIFCKMLNVTHFYLLVYHIGPLVDEQQIVLYEYVIPSDLQILLTLMPESNENVKQESNNDQPKFVPFTVSQTVHKSAFLSANFSNQEVKPRDFDVSQLESEFRKVNGHSLQQASALKDYFRYVVYDTPGVKDHQKDAKARYERYVDKKEQKKLKKKKDKVEKLDEPEPEEQECIQFIENKDFDDIADSKLGDCGSSLYISEHTYRQIASTTLDN